MEDVHLHGFHAIDISPQDVERNEVPADVEHQSSPWKARLIVNRNDRHVESVGAGLDQLQKCLQAVHRAERSRGVQFRAVRGNFQRVVLVFAEFLNVFAGVIGVNRQRRFAAGCCRRQVRESGFAIELLQEPRDRVLESRLRVAGQRDRK